MSQATHVSPLWLAESAACELQRLLSPVCERIAVAGSVRRRKEVCGDVELVAIPLVTDEARGRLVPEPVDRLEELLAIVARGDHHLLRRPAATAGRQPPWGPRQKKLCIRNARRWLPVDLWITTRGAWGCILALRTGDAAFSKLLVTREEHGGAMPAGLRQRDGRLEQLVSRQDAPGGTWEPLYVAEEQEFFEALGLPYVLPEERHEGTLRKLLSGKAV